MKIKNVKGNWYYSDGTKIKFTHHAGNSVWESHDEVIQLMDYEDKEDANDLIKKLEMILYD